ncbi:RidA family protein [soil metagenome]
MPERVSIFVEGAPNAFGHFSQVIKFGNAVHISGQLPVDPKTNKLVSDDVAEQSRAIMRSFAAILQACAGQLSNILSTRLYLIDLRDHKAFDDVAKEFFFFTPPARTVVLVTGLPFGARVMVEAVAELNPVEFSGKKLI